jgi:DNA repair exonuclease SbcCD ATPase subunit
VTTVFLQRIEISNFRAYGDNFSLSLPGPGVTILTGPEGPGKSGFFEAIEWALTGRVRRLEAPTQEGLDPGRNNGLLARREEDGPVAQYGVSLEFVNSEGERTRIERRAVREQENRERFAEVSSPTPQQLADLLGLVGPQNQLQAVLEAEERRRAAELKRDTLLRLSAARTKIAQAMTQKSSVTAQIDRRTHEVWMIQSYLHKTTKNIQRVKELDSRIQSLLLEKQEIPSHLTESGSRTQAEIEKAQAARDELPDLEYLNDHQAGMKARIDQLSSEIKEEHKIVAQLEEELLAAQALQQQYPELLAALGKLPSEEAHAIDEATRAVEQLVQEERQRWPALLLDDPLQPHDLTHAAALSEVLRDLVRDQKYQIILSLHDEELADSMRRQLEGAGIPCVTCRDAGLGPTGSRH